VHPGYTCDVVAKNTTVRRVVMQEMEMSCCCGGCGGCGCGGGGCGGGGGRRNRSRHVTESVNQGALFFTNCNRISVLI
jgi:hypothetical protein